MFTGLSAFPLTPLADDKIDERAFVALVERLVHAGVDSIGALGSTGSYAYLSAEERARATRLAVAAAGEVPVIVGIGDLRSSRVLQHAESAQRAGASGLLLAPISYQPLGDDEVFELFAEVCREASVPVVLYDNPRTTHVSFGLDLYERIAHLEQLASIKIPGVPGDPAAALARVQAIRAVIPDDVTIGVSGDQMAAQGLLAGCDAWYSVIAGTAPALARPIMDAVRADDAVGAREASARLALLWELFAQCGSLRVVAAIAEEGGLVGPDCLPRPVRGLGGDHRRLVAEFVAEFGLGA